MLDQLQSFTDSLPPFLQWLGVMAAGAVPFIESYGGSALGVAAGVHPVVAVAAAVIGNVATMLLAVGLSGTTRDRLVGAPREQSPRRQRLRARFDKWGVPGVSLLGQTLLPSQITSAALVSFGANRRQIIVWQFISIMVWGTVFATLVHLGVDVLRG